MLAPLAPDAHDLHWSVLDLGEVVPGDDTDPDPYIEPRVLESPRGWLLTFEELASFAASVRQVVDGVFIGCESPTRLPSRSDDDRTILNQAHIVVAAIDSSFWHVGAPDNVLDRAEAAFGEVSELEPGSVPLSTWGRDY